MTWMKFPIQLIAIRRRPRHLIEGFCEVLERDESFYCNWIGCRRFFQFNWKPRSRSGVILRSVSSDQFDWPRRNSHEIDRSRSAAKQLAASDANFKFLSRCVWVAPDASRWTLTTKINLPGHSNRLLLSLLRPSLARWLKNTAKQIQSGRPKHHKKAFWFNCTFKLIISVHYFVPQNQTSTAHLNISCRACKRFARLFNSRNWLTLGSWHSNAEVRSWVSNESWKSFRRASDWIVEVVQDDNHFPIISAVLIEPFAKQWATWSLITHRRALEIEFVFIVTRIGFYASRNSRSYLRSLSLLSHYSQPKKNFYNPKTVGRNG